MIEKIAVFAQMHNWNQQIEILIRERSPGSLMVAQPLEFREGQEGAIQDPTFRLSPEEAQQLIDALWLCGIRPSEGTGSAGSLKATQYHLEDMRMLVLNNIEERNSFRKERE